MSQERSADMEWDAQRTAALDAQAKGDPAGAERFWRRARRRADTLKDPDRQVEAGRHLAQLLLEQGRYVEARGELERALSQLPTNSVLRGPLLSDLAGARHRLGDLEGSEEMLRQAIALIETVTPVDVVQLMALESNLGGVLAQQERWEEVDSCWRRAFQLAEEHLEAGHPMRLGILDNLIGCLEVQGELEEAGRLLIRLLEGEAALGVEPLRQAQGLNRLGNLLARAGHPEEARTRYQQALSLAEAALGANHPGLETLRQNLGGEG